MKTVRLTLLTCVALALACPALAGDDPFGEGPPPPPDTREFKDVPTATWFKSLSSVYSKNCCDQSDCRKANSEWRGTPPYIDEAGKYVAGEGAWWAQSNHTGQWVKIEDNQITRESKENGGGIQYSLFDKAVLCEAKPPNDDVPVAQVYCFSPPPSGF